MHAFLYAGIHTSCLRHAPPRRWHATTLNDQFGTLGDAVSECSFELTPDAVLVRRPGRASWCPRTQDRWQMGPPVPVPDEPSRARTCAIRAPSPSGHRAALPLRNPLKSDSRAVRGNVRADGVAPNTRRSGHDAEMPGGASPVARRCGRTACSGWARRHRGTGSHRVNNRHRTHHHPLPPPHLPPPLPIPLHTVARQPLAHLAELGSLPTVRRPGSRR